MRARRGVDFPNTKEAPQNHRRYPIIEREHASFRRRTTWHEMTRFKPLPAEDGEYRYKRVS